MAARSPARPKPPRPAAPEICPSPGAVLRDEFLVPLGLSQNSLARALDVPPGRINEVVREMRGLTPDTAVRLAIYFDTSIEFWIDLQARYDADVARREIRPRVEPLIRRRAAELTAA